MTAPWRTRPVSSSGSPERDANEPSGRPPFSSVAGEDTFARSYKPGDIIANKYELRRKIAQGGMGAVWVAVNRVLHSEVALKLLRPELASDTAAERLLREARAAAQLQHPSVVRVFDFGVTERGDPFLVMELLEGESLARLLSRDGKLGGPLAVQMILPVLDGLAAAHARGVIHRDLKPDNIVLARDDTGAIRPKVLDFGIAKIASTTLPELERKLTRMGTVLGSPEYMSPEQARGVAEIDQRTDVWSISIVLYEMLTGDVPFRANNYHALMVAIVELPMPPLDGVDAELAAIVARGLHKDREERWPSVRALGRVLARWLIDRGVGEDISASSLRASWLVPGTSMPPVPPIGFAPVPRDVETMLAEAAVGPGLQASAPSNGHKLVQDPSSGKLAAASPSGSTIGAASPSGSTLGAASPSGSTIGAASPSGRAGSGGAWQQNDGASRFANLTGEGAAHEVEPLSEDFVSERGRSRGHGARWVGSAVALAISVGVGIVAWRVSLTSNSSNAAEPASPNAWSLPTATPGLRAEPASASDTAQRDGPPPALSVVPTLSVPTAMRPPGSPKSVTTHPTNAPRSPPSRGGVRPTETLASPATPLPPLAKPPAEAPPSRKPNDLGF